MRHRGQASARGTFIACVCTLLAIFSQPIGAQDLPSLLGEAQRLISRGQTLRALELIEEAKASAATIEGQALGLQEEVHWQDAMMNLEFADQLTEYQAYTSYAAKARRKWKEYLDWYHRLTSEEREKLPVSNRRVNMATAHLGNACSRMHDLSGLFEEYRNLAAIEYLGFDAIALWKNMLYQCPSWTPEAGREASVRRTKICNERCTEQWLVYAGSLEEWVDTVPLRSAVRESYLREAKQIREEAEGCAPDRP